MGKIYNGLNKEIMMAMKAGEKDRLNALKNLKAKLLEYKTSADGSKVVNANNGEIPDANEINVVKKYVKELQGDIETYQTAKPEMAEAARVEQSYLVTYLPKEASEEDIQKCVDGWMQAQGVSAIEQKQMGMVIKYVKSQFENADGGLVAKVVKQAIKG